VKRFVGPLLILLCTLIWGSAFVAQKTGAEHYAPFTLTCYRNILAGAFLAVVIFIRNRIKTHQPSQTSQTPQTSQTIFGGAISGVVLFAAMTAQQLGIETTTPGVSSFITSNYILIVPFLAWAIGRGRPRRSVWLGVVLALVGTYLICMPSSPSHGICLSSFRLNAGESWTLLCALLFAVQIMVVDRFAPKCDVPVFSMVQLFVAGLCAAPFMALPSEASRLTLAHFQAGWFSLFYVGILSSGIAYTLQNLGQARTPPALAALVMSFESVVGALSGYLVLGDLLSVGQLVGCGLVFGAIVFTSVSE